MSASSSILFYTERGAGPPLLLVHGLMATGEMFEPVIDRLATRHRLIIPDLRGHGKSREVGPPYTVAQLAADLSRLLDHLGIGSTAVLGYSQGGAIAQQLVLDDPKRCERLVLGCTYAFNMATFREKIEGRIGPVMIRALGMRRLARTVLSHGLKQVDPDRARSVIEMIGGQDRDLMIAAWKETMAFDSRQRLGEIRCPTLIIAGSKDDAVPMHHAHMLHDGIVGSKLVVIDGADHALIWARPGEFLRAVDAFLAA